MIKYLKGDLLKMGEDGLFDIIVHGANCFCTMGSGIARQIREQIPRAYIIDQGTTIGDYNKLGNYTQVSHTFNNGNTLTVINAYTQFDFNRLGENKDVFEYVSFMLILQKLAHHYPTNHFGFPYIGMGLAGGDKDSIIQMIDDFSKKITSQGGSVSLVEYQN